MTTRLAARAHRVVRMKDGLIDQDIINRAHGTSYVRPTP